MRISLIIPCYNEESNLQKGVLDKIGNYTKLNPFFNEVLIVDDGSTDNSKQIIRAKYLTLFPKFKLLPNEHAGKAFTIIKGIQESQNPYVLFSDIDLATPIEEADKLIAASQNKIPIIIGSRSTRRQGAPLFRKIMSIGAIIVKNIFIGLPNIRDTQCGFKLFRRDAALDIISRLRVFHNRHRISGSSVSAGFDLEFLFVASRLGYHVQEVPVDWRHVETHNVNFINDSYESLLDAFRIKYHDLRGDYQTKK
ncbi:glycosyltransferase [Candidatus Roizmanbacteria bacterium]|nr:glycosyltransferase [Candidatus Roizmanbacteria bacterium]